MKIPFIDLQAQYQAYKQEIDKAIQNVLDSSQYIMGPEVKKLEDGLARYTGSKHAIACSSGTDALLIALMAMDIQPGDEVITTPFTFISTTEVVSLLGAIPVFVDIEPDTFNIDSSKIEDKITAKTKAIIPVSLYGQVADMYEINAIAAKYNLIVIEDGAQSFGATYKGKKSCNLSDFGCTSFFPSKPLGCYGDGGALFTNNDALAEKSRMILAHGSRVRYQHEVVGINGRLDAIQAAILNVKLKYFAEEVQKRKEIGAAYTELLKGKGLSLPVVKHDRTSVYAQFTVRSEQREKLLERFNSNGVPTAIYYPKPLHLQQCYESLGYKTGDFPIAEKAAKEVFSLPISPFITFDQQQFIVEKISS
ncbi:MAG: aminotransferase DegT [Flavobacteriales bacterium]|nr:aminotransferase DegT [Flavobacteriales bacterium]|tara:strand:+ start:22 stop:1113 length:1092 start_codon:yes stop_codon:yes gene_type:complete